MGYASQTCIKSKSILISTITAPETQGSSYHFLAMTSIDRSPLCTEFHFKFQKIQDVLKITLNVSIQSKANQGLITNHSQDNIVFKKRIQLSAKSLLSYGWQFQTYIFIWKIPWTKLSSRQADPIYFPLTWKYFRSWSRLLSFWRIREYFIGINIRREKKTVILGIVR